MSTTALRHPYDSAEASFLQFGKWSLFLHLGILALFSALPLGEDIEITMPVMNVSLVEIPDMEPAKEEASFGVPPLMSAQRPMSSPQPTVLPTPKLAHPSSMPITLAHIAPLTPPPASVSQDDRRVIRDRHAVASLKLQHYMKSVKPTTTQPSTLAPVVLPLGLPTPQPTMVEGIPSPVTTSRGSPRPIFSQSAQNPLLKASPSGSGDISRSKVRLGKTSPPVYPRIARESGWEGTVVVRLIVLADGTTDIVRIRKSSGHTILDHAALDAVKHWQFVPAKDGNIPIPRIVEIPIHFDLHEQG